MKKKIAIYGGVFDPIHLGHLHLASEVQEWWGLDEVWFVPAYQSPHKDQALATAENRLEMVKIAIEPFPSFRVLDYELRRKGRSYTIDTIREIKQKHLDEIDEKKFFLLIGEDALSGLPKWEAVDALIDEVQILVGKRFRESSFPQMENKRLYDAVIRGFTDNPIFEINSTEIREKLIKKFNCAHLVGAKVLDYIGKNQLYCPL